MANVRWVAFVQFGARRDRPVIIQRTPFPTDALGNICQLLLQVPYSLFISAGRPASFISLANCRLHTPRSSYGMNNTPL